MAKSLLACILLFLFLAPKTLAADYVVRLEVLGYKDVPEAVAAPEETVSHRMELVCRPDAPTRCKVQIGKETLTLAVVLHPAKDNKFKLDFDFCQSVDTGELVPDGKGGRKKQDDRTRSVSQTTLHIGERFLSGGVESTKTDDKGRVTKSKEMFRLSLQNYVPPKEEE